MFGFIIPNFETLTKNEKDRYKSVYCGLCHSLKNNYSNVSRLALSYDLTFLILLLSSLYEPKETQKNCNCIFHPGKKFIIKQNVYSNFCADMTIILAYHKIKDDVVDDNSIKSKIGKIALNNQYKKVYNKYKNICCYIERQMKDINNLENNNLEVSGDKIAKKFGLVLTKIFVPYDDIFSNDLAKFAANLGRFIYFMDAAFDIEDDFNNKSYNPYFSFIDKKNITKNDALKIKDQLKTFAGMALQSFEKLPLEQDLNLLQNILYEGIWTRFNYKYFRQ